MDLHDSLKPVIIVQKLFRISVVSFDKNGIRTSRLMIFLAIVALISTFFNYGYGFYKVIENADYLIRSNPVDNSSFSAIVLILPGIMMVFSLLGIWSLSIFHRQRDIDLYTVMSQVDQILRQFKNLKYEEFHSKSAKWTIATFICSVLVFLVPFYGAKVKENYAFIIIILAFNGIVFMFYGCTLTFVTFVVLARDRLDVIVQVAASTEKASHLGQLMNAEKLLTRFIEIMNLSVCFKQTFVIVTNWIGMSIQGYLILINVVFWTENTLIVMRVLIPTLAPHVFMVCITSYYGNELEVYVSVKLKLTVKHLNC